MIWYLLVLKFNVLKILIANGLFLFCCGICLIEFFPSAFCNKSIHHIIGSRPNNKSLLQGGENRYDTNIKLS